MQIISFVIIYYKNLKSIRNHIPVAQMIKFLSVFLLFWSNDYNILSCQPFHDERFPTLSENYGYLYYCTFKVLSRWFKKNFVFTCKTIDNSKVWGQLAFCAENLGKRMKKKYVWRKHEFIPMPYWKGWYRSNLSAWTGSTEYFSNKSVWILKINRHKCGFIIKIVCLFVWYCNYLQYKFCWV